MLKAIVFDFDGIIVDSEPLHYRAFLRVGERLGVRFSYEEYLDTYIGYDDRDAFRVMLGLPAGAKSGGADEARIAALVEEKADAFEAIVGEGIAPIAGAPELIRGLSGVVPIAIASGATARDIELILRRLDLHASFEAIVSADQVAKSKPDPASYALAVETLARRLPALRIEPGDCLAIEDTAAGVESARGAGLLTLGMTTTGTAEKLHRAHRVVAGFEGLTWEGLRAWFD
jgi:HAD superfamily hydrolase (TIGR01509 family)